MKKIAVLQIAFIALLLAGQAFGAELTVPCPMMTAMPVVNAASCCGSCPCQIEDAAPTVDWSTVSAFVLPAADETVTYAAAGVRPETFASIRLNSAAISPEQSPQTPLYDAYSEYRI